MLETKQNPPACEFDIDKLVIEIDTLVPSDIKIIDRTVDKILRKRDMISGIRAHSQFIQDFP